MLYNYYWVKNNKFGDKSTTTEAREKICTVFESLRILEFYGPV